MILFVFEGKDDEPRIYKTLKHLFFNKNAEEIIICYCNNIYSLYKKMKEYDVLGGAADIVSVLKEEAAKHPENPYGLSNIRYSYQVSETYLFFDYDIKRQDKSNRLTVKEQNEQIAELLEYFCNETDKGKLYINYPMVESFRYFKKPLPDYDYKDYTAPLFIGRKFKQMAGRDSYYKNFDRLCFALNKHGELKLPDETKQKEIQENWEHIKKLNVMKANLVSKGSFSMPESKDDISQSNILAGQLLNYVNNNNEIAILNSFALFLYEYLRG